MMSISDVRLVILLKYEIMYKVIQYNIVQGIQYNDIFLCIKRDVSKDGTD